MPAQYAAPAWGQNPYHDLKVPSGGLVQVKLIDLEAIVAADMVDDFDKLSGVADEKVVQPSRGKRPADRPAKKPTKAEKAAAEAQAMRDFFKQDNLEMLTSLMGRILPQVIIQPKVVSPYVKEDGAWVKLPQEDRVDGTIYVDSIPFADQMHILSFCMEGMDMGGLQQFREQSEEAVGDVGSQPTFEDPPV